MADGVMEQVSFSSASVAVNMASHACSRLPEMPN
jgi:hypothetical protein